MWPCSLALATTESVFLWPSLTRTNFDPHFLSFLSSICLSDLKSFLPEMLSLDRCSCCFDFYNLESTSVVHAPPWLVFISRGQPTARIFSPGVLACACGLSLWLHSSGPPFPSNKHVRKSCHYLWLSSFLLTCVRFLLIIYSLFSMHLCHIWTQHDDNADYWKFQLLFSCHLFWDHQGINVLSKSSFLIAHFGFYMKVSSAFWFFTFWPFCYCCCY